MIHPRIAALALFAVGCAKTPDPSPSTAQPSDSPPPAPATERPELTASECDDAGGTVVGDIGDGAIHRPDYVCAQSGEPPLGTIAADPGGPIGVEGSVCCKEGS